MNKHYQAPHWLWQGSRYACVEGHHGFGLREETKAKSVGAFESGGIPSLNGGVWPANARSLMRIGEVISLIGATDESHVGSSVTHGTQTRIFGLGSRYPAA